MAKAKLKKDIPEFLQQRVEPTLVDEDGEKSHPLVIAAMRSKWTEDGRTFQGVRLSLAEKGRQLILTVYSKTAHQKADMYVNSIVTLFDELNEAFANHTLNWVMDYDAERKSDAKLEAPIE